MEKIKLETLGISLTVSQIENLVKNARRYRTENIVLREELNNLKKLNETSQKEVQVL